MIIETSMLAKAMQVIIATAAMLQPNGQYVDRQEAFCLAEVAFHEARSISFDEMLRMAAFTKQFAEYEGKTICEEVHGKDGRYSWNTNDIKKSLNMLTNKGEMEAWKQASEIAVLLIAGSIEYDLPFATNALIPNKNSPNWYKNNKHRIVYEGEQFVFLDLRDVTS